MFRKALYYLDKAITLFEEWTLFLTVSAALVTLFVSVAMRFGARYGITSTLAWPEEFVREVIVYSTFVGCVAAVKSRSLIRVDALPNIVKSWKKPLEILSNITMVFFAVFITWFGVKMALFQYKMGMSTIILKIPQVCLYSILPIMGIGMLCRLLQVFYEDITGTKVSDLEAGG